MSENKRKAFRILQLTFIALLHNNINYINGNAVYNINCARRYNVSFWKARRRQLRGVWFLEKLHHDISIWF